MSAVAVKFGQPDGPTTTQALRPSRFTSPGHVRNDWAITLEAGVPFETVLSPGFLKLCVSKGVGLADIIEVRSDSMDFWGRVIVTAADAPRSYIKVQRLEYVQLQKETADEDTGAAYRIEDRGITDKFAIVRNVDNVTV